MCQNCVVESAVITEQPLSNSDDNTVDNPQTVSEHEVPLINTKAANTDTTVNLNSNNFEPGDDSISQVTEN